MQFVGVARRDLLVERAHEVFVPVRLALRLYDRADRPILVTDEPHVGNGAAWRSDGSDERAERRHRAAAASAGGRLRQAFREPMNEHAERIE